VIIEKLKWYKNFFYINYNSISQSKLVAIVVIKTIIIYMFNDLFIQLFYNTFSLIIFIKLKNEI